MRRLLPLLFLVPSPAFGDAVQLEWRDIPLPPECANTATAIIPDFRKCKPMNLELHVKKADGTSLATVIGLGRNHYHPSEVRGSLLFWVKRGDTMTYGPDGKPANDIELWVMDLQTRKAEKLGESRDLDYRTSPNGERVVMVRGREVSLVDRKTAASTLVFETQSMANSDAIELQGWQSDTSFTFHVGIGEECKKVGRYRDGSLDWRSCPELQQ